MGAYQNYISAGHTPEEWDIYREQQSRLSRAASPGIIIANFHAGVEMSGNDILGVLDDLPADIKRTLTAHDTAVSKTSVSGRGIGKRQMKRVHQYVSLGFNAKVLK